MATKTAFAAACVLAFLAGGAQAGTTEPVASGHGSSDKAASDHGSSDHGGASATKDRSGDQVAAKDAAHGGAKQADHGGAHWGYSGKEGPENWGRLSKDYHMCLQGAEQSPIDIGGAGFDGATVAPIDFDYRLSPVEILNNGHTIQVNYAPGSSITVRGKRFELLQFHFHTPSEHAVDGQRAPMEAHLVHKSADGELAVVGVMMREGEENLALSEFWDLMPHQAGEKKRDKRALINARDLLPHDTGFYRYMGSLTTPPCSEGVHWHVMAEPVSIGARQIQQFAKVVGDNARPVQPQGKRLVLGPGKAE